MIPRVDLEAIARLCARERVLGARPLKYDASVTQSPEIAALRDAHRALSEAGIAHALIGGLAVGIHSGIPRATLDIDLAVRSTTPRDKLVTLMTGAAFRLVGEFAHSVNFRHSSGEPVQLACDPVFDLPISRAEPYDAGDFEVPIVTKNDLIALKRRAAQDPTRRRSKALRDEADVALLLGDVPDPDEGW